MGDSLDAMAGLQQAHSIPEFSQAHGKPKAMALPGTVLDETGTVFEWLTKEEPAMGVLGYLRRSEQYVDRKQLKGLFKRWYLEETAPLFKNTDNTNSERTHSADSFSEQAFSEYARILEDVDLERAERRLYAFRYGMISAAVCRLYQINPRQITALAESRLPPGRCMEALHETKKMILADYRGQSPDPNFYGVTHTQIIINQLGALEKLVSEAGRANS